MAAPQSWSDTPHPYVGVPKPYPLDLTEKSWFGLPWYHFRCDWELNGPSPEHNLYDSSGDAAQIGDRVYKWSNAYGGGVGDATVHPDSAYYGGVAAPRLVEIVIEGQPFKALSFTGKEYLGINGAEAVSKYDLSDGALFATCGTLYQDKSYAGPGSRAGASFVFVVSANTEMRNGYYWNYSQGVSPYSALLYGRHPQTNSPPYGDDLGEFCTNNPWSPWCPSGGAEPDIPSTEYGWGPVEDDGIEFWYAAGTPNNLPHSTEDWGYGGGSTTMMKFGPQGWHVVRGGGTTQWASPYIPTREENNIGNMKAKRGGSDGGFLNPPGFSIWGFPNYWPDCQSTPKTGLQALLVEYVNEDITGPSHTDIPNSWPELLAPYNGPTVNVYGISKEWLPRAENDPPKGCPGFGSAEEQMLKPVYTNKEICVSPAARTNPLVPAQLFDLMKYPHSYPAMKDKTLWHNKYLYLGGLPAVALTSEPAGNDGKYGHGFKGYIFEVLFLEGVLNNSDKVTLFNTLKAKYNKGLG